MVTTPWFFPDELNAVQVIIGLGYEWIVASHQVRLGRFSRRKIAKNGENIWPSCENYHWATMSDDGKDEKNKKEGDEEEDLDCSHPEVVNKYQQAGSVANGVTTLSFSWKPYHQRNFSSPLSYKYRVISVHFCKNCFQFWFEKLDNLPCFCNWLLRLNKILSESERRSKKTALYN